MKMWSYWVFRYQGEVSIWQVVPDPGEDGYAKGYYPAKGDDMFLKAIEDLTDVTQVTSHTYEYCTTGGIYPYDSLKMNENWELIQKDDIPLVVLGEI